MCVCMCVRECICCACIYTVCIDKRRRACVCTYLGFVERDEVFDSGAVVEDFSYKVHVARVPVCTCCV
jgi:hypothetical protein